MLFVLPGKLRLRVYSLQVQKSTGITTVPVLSYIRNTSQHEAHRSCDNHHTLLCFGPEPSRIEVQSKDY
ncbi:hypothetical protein PCANC_03882 [Puccinia coronata f. sp. avenae]|uniref:Uncharacterized protein n=1 Tax=Puccinia coronata f. sp. avenae TaxID=200324 RepID=A0A2N5W1F1_9BASI|nr:hypothetical protein PCANC_03882 [Puccinia coronata f. sp. avenae]